MEWQAAASLLLYHWLHQSFLVCMWRGVRSPLMKPVWHGSLHGEEEAPRVTAALANSSKGALMIIPRHLL